MNDDFFFLQPVDEIKNYSRGLLEDMIDKHPTKGGYYYRSLVDTRSKLRHLGFADPIDFEIHGPMVFDKEKFLTVMGIVSHESDKAFSLRSCYGNIMHLEPENIMDFKAMNIAEFAYQIQKNREMLSIGDGLVAEEDFRDWIGRKFPIASSFEMDEGAGQTALPGRSMEKMRYYAIKNFTYGSKKFNIGEIIDHDIIEGIKDSPKMRGLWKLQ